MISIVAKVVHGKALGRTMGFATANQDTSEIKERPKYGVYASKVWVDSNKYIGVTNVGTRPTVDNENKITIETHILDFNEDIYDKVIRVDLCHYLRGISKFANKEELIAQVQKDEQCARELLG